MTVNIFTIADASAKIELREQRPAMVKPEDTDTSRRCASSHTSGVKHKQVHCSRNRYTLHCHYLGPPVCLQTLRVHRFQLQGQKRSSKGFCGCRKRTEEQKLLSTLRPPLPPQAPQQPEYVQQSNPGLSGLCW